MVPVYPCRGYGSLDRNYPTIYVVSDRICPKWLNRTTSNWVTSAGVDDRIVSFALLALSIVMEE